MRYANDGETVEITKGDLNEAIALLLSYRVLAREQVATVKHTKDYWSNELQRTEDTLAKLGEIRSS